MDLSVNFQKVKRNYMTLTFDDPKSEKGVKVIVVGMPKKKVFDALMDMQDTITEREEAQNAKERSGANRRTIEELYTCLLYTSPSPRDVEESRMPSSA